MFVTSPKKPDLSERVERAGWRRRLAVGAVLVAGVGGLLSGGVVSPAVAADGCANGAVRAQTGSAGLPDCRAYEMVTPPYKEGFPVEGSYLRFNDDGVFSYLSRGAVAGNTQGSSNNLYHAVRSAAGWMTSSLDPSAVTYDTAVLGQTGQPVLVESPDLRWSLWRMFRRDEPEPKVGFWLRGPDGAFTRVGDALPAGAPAYLGPRGTSADLSHGVFSIAIAGGDTSLREYVGVGNLTPPRPVSVDNGGLPTPGETCLRSVSSDGRVAVFSSGCNGTAPLQVWARVGGTATVAVSGSECTRGAGDPGGLCNGPSPAAYEGASADGSRVFFTTGQQLVNGDIDATDDLYACDIPAGAPAPVGSANACSTLTEVSGAANGAQVQSVVAVSKDGSRVYFVARGVLSNDLGVGGVGPRAGAYNLYVWDRDAGHPAGQTRYVARLADGADPAKNDLTRAQITPDGRYLLFATVNPLVAGGPEADTDGAMDVYRYDAGTHQLVRVSTSVVGGGGNGAGFDVSIPAAVAMSADGSTVVFDSAEALSASDTNGVTDVYGWHDGQVSLLSAGGGNAVGVTASARDIFFVTDAPVLSADRDINRDIYDARVDGGITVAQLPSPCSGEACRGQRSRPPGLAGPSRPESGSGPVAEPTPAFSLRAVSAAQRRALATTGKVTLTVTANVAGTVSARATATIGGRSVAVGSARRMLSVPGRVAVTLTLSKKARAQLASRRRLTVRVAVSHSKVALDRAVTLRLVRSKAKGSAKRASARRSIAGVGEGRS